MKQEISRTFCSCVRSS